MYTFEPRKPSAPRPVTPAWVLAPMDLLTYLTPQAVAIIRRCTFDSRTPKANNPWFRAHSASAHAQLLGIYMQALTPWALDDDEVFVVRLLQYIQPQVFQEYAGEIRKRVFQPPLEALPPHEAITEAVLTFIFERMERDEKEARLDRDREDGLMGDGSESVGSGIAHVAKGSWKCMTQVAKRVGRGAAWHLSSEAALDRFRFKSGGCLRNDHEGLRRSKNEDSPIRSEKKHQDKGLVARIGKKLEQAALDHQQFHSGGFIPAAL